MYEHANPHMNSRKRRSGQPKWLRIQQLAFQEGNESELELQKLVLEAERRSINLPVIRQAITTAAGVEADHIVILDIVSPIQYSSEYIQASHTNIPNSAKPTKLFTKLQRSLASSRKNPPS